MEWNDIRQHVDSIHGNLPETGDRQMFIDDCVAVSVDDGWDLDEQDTEFLCQYAGEYWDRN